MVNAGVVSTIPAERPPNIQPQSYAFKVSVGSNTGSTIRIKVGSGSLFLNGFQFAFDELESGDWLAQTDATMYIWLKVSYVANQGSADFDPETDFEYIIDVEPVHANIVPTAESGSGEMWVKAGKVVRSGSSGSYIVGVTNYLLSDVYLTLFRACEGGWSSS